MDFEEFEKLMEKKTDKGGSSSSSSCGAGGCGNYSDIDAMMDEFDAYMYGGRAEHRGIGFHLPHRTRNDS